MNKIVVFLFPLFSFFILFCSCNNKNNVPLNQKIAYVQSSQSSTSVNNILSSNIFITTSKPSPSSASSANNASSASSAGNVSSASSAGNVLINSDFLRTSSTQSAKSSQISPSSHASQSSLASYSSNTSQSSQTVQVSSAVNLTVIDAVNLYNNALNNTLNQDYICFNFSNTMNGGKALQQFGNIVLENANENVFKKTLIDGTTFYCDGNNVFIQQIISIGNQIKYNLSYTHKDFYKYINLIMYALDTSNIKSFDENTNADTTNIIFEVTNCSDYSKIADIFSLNLAKTTINKVTLTVQIKDCVITNFVQQFEITYNGIQSECKIDNTFYNKEKSFVLTAP